MCGPPCAPMLSSLFSGGAPKNVQLAALVPQPAAPYLIKIIARR
jgi:hypothetical protein